jgi:hypothetical protein
LRKPGAARAGGDTDGEHRKHSAREHRFVATPKKVGSRRNRWRRGALFSHCKSPVVFVHRLEHTDCGQYTLNRLVQAQLSLAA